MLTTRLMQMPPSLLVAATGGPRGRRVLRRPASLSAPWAPSFSDSRDEDVWALQPREVPQLLDRVDADAEQLGDAELGHHRVGLSGVQVGVVEDPAQALLPPDLLHGVAVAEVADRAAELPGNVLFGFLQAHPAGHLHARDQVSVRADPSHARGGRRGASRRAACAVALRPSRLRHASTHPHAHRPQPADRGADALRLAPLRLHVPLPAAVLRLGRGTARRVVGPTASEARPWTPIPIAQAAGSAPRGWRSGRPVSAPRYWRSASSSHWHTSSCCARRRPSPRRSSTASGERTSSS